MPDPDVRYVLLSDASNDPEGNCEREWRRSSRERMHAAAAAALDQIQRGSLDCPDCGAAWPDFDRGESCRGCGLSTDDVNDAAAFLTSRRNGAGEVS